MLVHDVSSKIFVDKFGVVVHLVGSALQKNGCHLHVQGDIYVMIFKKKKKKLSGTVLFRFFWGEGV